MVDVISRVVFDRGFGRWSLVFGGLGAVYLAVGGAIGGFFSVPSWSLLRALVRVSASHFRFHLRGWSEPILGSRLPVFVSGWVWIRAGYLWPQIL